VCPRLCQRLTLHNKFLRHHLAYRAYLRCSYGFVVAGNSCVVYASWLPVERGYPTVTLSEVVAAKQLVIFDLFFTLVSTDVEVDRLAPTYDVLGVSKAAWRRQTSASVSSRLTGQVSDPYAIVRTMAHAIDPTIPSSVVAGATDERIARFARLLQTPPPAALTALKALRTQKSPMQGLRTALISNADVIEAHGRPESPLACILHECGAPLGGRRRKAQCLRQCPRLCSSLQFAPARVVAPGFMASGSPASLADPRSTMATAMLFATIGQSDARPRRHNLVHETRPSHLPRLFGPHASQARARFVCWRWRVRRAARSEGRWPDDGLRDRDGARIGPV
jgi:hypothetical protein